jgi:hypothetical protein
MTDRYEIRVSGRLGPVLCAAFADMEAVVVPRRFVIDGWLSRDEFRALVIRMEQVRGELLQLDCAVGDQLPPTEPHPGSTDGAKDR